jgi:hypothetical protein
LREKQKNYQVLTTCVWQEEWPLNCVANGKLDDAGIFKQVFVQPAAGDAGGALGAAYAAYHIYYDQPRIS